MNNLPTEVLGLVLLAVLTIGCCGFIVREIVIACVPELRRQNRRRSLWL